MTFGMIFKIIFLGLPSLLVFVVGAKVLWLVQTLILGIAALVARSILWREGIAPWNHKTLLSAATAKAFLSKTDFSFRFQHSLLMDHFAERASDEKTYFGAENRQLEPSGG
jgi:hypothetical protein